MNDDPLAFHESIIQSQREAEARVSEYSRLTRKIFLSPSGKRWLALSMARINFMGSVFSMDDGWNSTQAAFRDGARSVFSDILNEAANTNHDNDNDE